MGRGRAKAKQQKVARRLKYSGGGTDLDRLRSELGVSEDMSSEHDDSIGDPYEEDLAERYADYAGDDEDDEGRPGNGRV